MTFWLIGGLAVLAAGAIQGCIGFGLALVLAPCLMALHSPPVAVAMVMMLSLLNTAMVLAGCWQDIQPRLLLPILAGALVGLPLGVHVVTTFAGPVFEMSVGLMVLTLAVIMLLGKRWPVRNERAALVPVGLAAGVLGGSTGIGGPPIALFLANQHTPKLTARANMIAFFLLINIIGLALFVRNGVVTSEVATSAAGYVPFLVVGTLAGMWMASRVSQQRFRQASVALAGGMGGLLLAMNLYRLLGAGTTDA